MPVKDDAGEVQFICFTVLDVTDTSIYQSRLEETTAKLREMSSQDGLTKLFNRRHIEEVLSTEYERARRYDHSFSVILTDIDFFKKVNDNYGHLAGDEVLRVVSKRLSDTLRDTDIIGRYGGEEFIIALPETNMDGAEIVAERLRKAIGTETINAEGVTLSISISLGVTEMCDTTAAYAQLIAEADLALCTTRYFPGIDKDET